MKGFIVSSAGPNVFEVTYEEFRESINILLVGPPNENGVDIHFNFIDKRPEPKVPEGACGVVYTVPMHPACRFGDCDGDCRVYDCGIRQGYNEAPSSIEECDMHHVDAHGKFLD